MKNANLKATNLPGESIYPNLSGKVNDTVKLETDTSPKNDFGASAIAVALISTFGPIIYSKIKDKLSDKDVLIQVINSCKTKHEDKDLYSIQFKVTNFSEAGIYFDKIIINEIKESKESKLTKYQLSKIEYYYDLNESKSMIKFGSSNINEKYKIELAKNFQKSIYFKTSTGNEYHSQLINLYMDLSNIQECTNETKIAKIEFIYSKLDENIKSEEIKVLLRS